MYTDVCFLEMETVFDPLIPYSLEPAILVMHHSMKPHPAITATLLDFMCRVSAMALSLSHSWMSRGRCISAGLPVIGSSQCALTVGSQVVMSPTPQVSEHPFHVPTISRWIGLCFPGVSQPQDDDQK
jgi:hypothetical protein